MAGLVALPLALAPAGAALAQGVCSTNITGPYQGTLIVSSGNTCVTYAHITGSVVVQSGASVDIEYSTLDGAVESTRANDLTICGSTLGSLSAIKTRYNEQIGGGLDTPCIRESEGQTEQRGNTIKGGVTLDGSWAFSELENNKIGGGVTVENFKGEGEEIEGNWIGGSLTCVNNVNAPVNDGYVNTVKGARNGQCSGIDTGQPC